MVFIVDEKGCQKLSDDMSANMKAIAMLVAKIEAENETLKAALGDDYESIAKTVRIITRELETAQVELNTIINSMNEYMSRVHKVRISLN